MQEFHLPTRRQLCLQAAESSKDKYFLQKPSQISMSRRSGWPWEPPVLVISSLPLKKSASLNFTCCGWRHVTLFSAAISGVCFGLEFQWAKHKSRKHVYNFRWQLWRYEPQFVGHCCCKLCRRPAACKKSTVHSSDYQKMWSTAGSIPIGSKTGIVRVT